MTFSEFILLSREYLHDLRKNDGTIITSASEDGIRWSSVRLISVCKGALKELLRTLNAYKLTGFVNSDIFYQFVNCRITPTTGIVGDLPVGGLYSIEKISHPTLKRIYEAIPATKFFSEYYFTQPVESGESIPVYYFTTVLDGTTGLPITHSVPVGASLVIQEEGYRALIKKDFEAFLTITGDFSTNLLPFSMIDDLMFDYVVKTASARSHDEATLAYVVKEINFKLGMLKNELQRAE